MRGFENPVECIERAAEAIKTGMDLGIYKGHLCFYNDTLAFRDSKHTKKNHPILFKVTLEMTVNGLNSDEWTLCSKQMWNFFKELR